jgi:hypothetical protein
MLEQTIKDQVFRCILAISQGIGWLDLGRPAVRLLQLDGTIWICHPA